MNIKDIFKIDELNSWLKDNVDKNGLEENYLDGHGYEINSNKTVYLINETPIVFDIQNDAPEKEKWFYTVRIVNKYILWKDVPKFNSKMKARF